MVSYELLINLITTMTSAYLVPREVLGELMLQNLHPDAQPCVDLVETLAAVNGEGAIEVEHASIQELWIIATHLLKSRTQQLIIIQ